MSGQSLVDANVFIRDLTAMKSMYDAISLDGMIKALKEAPTVTLDDIKPKCEWINVKDRLPKEDVRVLVYLGNYDSYPVIDTDRIIRSSWVRWDRYVTHWMQLPDKPYMRGEDK